MCVKLLFFSSWAMEIGFHHASSSHSFLTLGFRGQNLILNAADHGTVVCAFNRTVAKVDRFLDNEAKGEICPESVLCGR